MSEHERPELVTVNFLIDSPVPMPIVGPDWGGVKVWQDTEVGNYAPAVHPRFESVFTIENEELGVIEVSPHSYAPTVRPENPIRYGLLGFSSLRRWVLFWVLSVALMILFAFASGCGLDEHAKKTESLEKRIGQMEKQWDNYIALDAATTAETEAGLAYVYDAIEWMRRYLQRLQRQEMSE